MDFRAMGGQVAAPGWVAASSARPRAQSPSPQANSFAPATASTASASSAAPAGAWPGQSPMSLQQPAAAGVLRAQSPTPMQQSSTAAALSFGGPVSARGAPSMLPGEGAAGGMAHAGAPSAAADIRLRPRVGEDFASAPRVVMTQVPTAHMQDVQQPMSPMGPLSPMRAVSPTPVRMQSATNLTTSVLTQASSNAASTPGMPLSASMRTHTASTATMPPSVAPAPATAPVRTQAGVPIYQVPQMSVPIRAVPTNPLVAVPLGTLTHIDSIVSEMERELSEIRATEVRQEVLELKEKHLSQLRRILAEDLVYNSEDRDDGAGADARVGPGRLTLLETDYLAMRQQVSDLEQKHGKHSVPQQEDEELVRMRAEVEAEKLRARLAEERLAEYEARLEHEQRCAEAREAQGEELQKCEVRRLEAALESEQLSSAEALEARAAAEEDLQKLEANFRAMMEDCQALQVKIQELTAERDLAVEAERIIARDGISAAQSELSSRLALLEETQKRIAELEEESSGHQSQAKLHRARTGELEVQVQDLHGELQTHRGHHETKDKRIQELLDEIANHMEQQGKHRSRLQELEKLLLDAKDENDGHHRQHSTHKLKIGELEQLLEDAQSEITRHQSSARQSVTHRARVSELETELMSAQADKDTHHRQHLKRIADLERQLEEQRLADQNHSRQHTSNRGKIQELERSLAERESAEGNHNRQHTTNRARIKELEQQQLDLQTSHDNHLRQNKEHRRRITELQQELDNGRFSEGDKARMDKAHRTALADLQTQLNAAETEQKKYMQQNVGHRQRVTELEAELTLLREAEANHQRMHSTHKKRISDVEEELANQEAFHTRRHTEAKTRIEELTGELDTHHGRIRELENAGPPVGLVEELDGRVTTLMQELAQARSELSASRSELDAARQAAESVQRDADRALSAQESLLQSRTMEMEEKLNLAQQKIQGLEAQLARQDGQKRVTVDAPPARPAAPASNSVPDNIRGSLVGQVAQRKVGLTGTLLPGSNDAFVVKVRAFCKVSHDALREAAEMNARCVRTEIEKLLEDSKKGTSLKSAVSEFSHRAEMLSERQAVGHVLESSITDLRAYRDELEIQRHLSAGDREEILARIDLDIERCQDELALLDASSSLGELPEVILQGLVDLHTPGATPRWTDGFSPMHWAAQYGRQDLIEYLVSVEGGRALLEAPDSRGHSPLYYAQLGSRKALIIWLTEEMGTKAPVHTHNQTPTFDNIPPLYQKVLAQVREHGWRSMSWKDGYTMLHWAANKGHTDICTYLVELDADPNKADGHGRTPIDIARNNRNDELTDLLQDLRSRRRASRRV